MKRDLIRKGMRYLVDGDYRFEVNSRHGFYHDMPDEMYLRRLYKATFGQELDLENPRTFNEKLQWLKLHDHNPEYTTMVDKYAAKKWVADRIGEEYIIPTLGVWDHFDEIDFDALPKQFVLKCTHDSGGIIFVKDKKKFNKSAAKHKLERCLRRNFYYIGREWPYKDVPPRIIAEPYLTDESGVELKDYKIFSFDGDPKVIQVDYDRFKDHKRNLYSTDWQYIEATIMYPTDPTHKIPEPKGLHDMLELASKLSQGYPHVRTDFYNIDGKILFGELTLLHGAGLEKFTPPEFGVQMGDWLKLPSGGGIIRTDNIVLYVRPSTENDGAGLNDYKILCFDSEPKIVEIHRARFTEEHTQDFYNIDWKPSGIKQGPASKNAIEKPKNYERMLELSSVLARGLTHLRIDWYEVNDKLYFGEITFYDGAGLDPFDDLKSEMILGDMIHLPLQKVGG